MNFEPTETQSAIRDLARKIFKDRVTPASYKALPEDRFDRALYAQLAEAGLLGAALPEAYGGGGEDFLALAVLLEAAGFAAAPLPLWETLCLGALPIADHGTEEQKQRLLPRVAAGELVLTAALVEAGSDDPRHTRTRAEPNGSGWKLTGTKECVPAATLAGRVLVPARTAPDRVAVFIVDPTAVGVELTPQTTTTGEPQARMTLSGVRVPAADLLGDRTDAAGALEAWLQRATVGLCAMQLGVCQSALRMTAKYTAERVQFDRPIATFQAVAQRAADAYIDVETIRLSMWEAAWRLSQSEPAAEAVAIAKYWAAEAGHRVVYAAQHLHGGMGYDMDYPLAKYYPLAKKLELGLGGPGTQLARLGELLASRPDPR